MQSPAKATSCPSTLPNAAANGFSDISRFGLPLGRPKWESSSTLAPFLVRSWPAGDAHLLQVFEQFARHAFGQVDEGELVADVDAADVLGFQVRLVGDGAADVARLHAMVVADFAAEDRKS